MKFAVPCIYLMFVSSWPWTGNGLAQELPLKPLNETQWRESFSRSINEVREGTLTYTQNNAEYLPSGFNWPWANVLGLRSKNLDIANDVGTQPYDFLFNPRWMPSGDVIFQYGDFTSSYNTYALALWDRKVGKATTLLKNLYWKVIQPSPTGRYLAFVRGGQPLPVSGGAAPTFVYTLDLKTGEEKRWGKSQVIPNSISWAGDNTLLFSLIPTDEEIKAIQAKNKAKEAEDEIINWKPQIYALSLPSGNFTSLMLDATRPVTSPDGKWLLFDSYNNPSPEVTKVPYKINPDPTLPRSAARSGAYLVLSKADGSEQRLVRRGDRKASKIIWYPDSSGFALCDTRFIERTGDVSSLAVTVSVCGIDVAQPKRVGEFKYFVPPGMETSEDKRLWRPIAVTQDKQFLVSELTQFESLPNNGLMLHRFNLQSGEAEIMTRVERGQGLDWRESPIQ